MKQTIKTITSADYAAKKKLALETAPVRKLVNIGDISIKDDEIFIEKSKVEFSQNGIFQLAELMGVPKAFVVKYQKMFGDAGRNKLLNHIASGLGSRNKNIMLIGSPVTKNIIDVQPSGHKYISTKSFFDVVENTMNDHPDLIMSEFFVDKRGQLRIDTLNPNRPFNFGKDEDFFSGMNYTQSPRFGTQLSQYVMREVCTNGMFGKDDIKLSLGYDDDVIKNLYSSINKVAEFNFMPEGFGERIKRASTVNASLSELYKATNFMPSDPITIDRFIPYQHVMQDLKRRGIDVKGLNSQQEKNCRIDCSVWDVINAMTDFASHDYGFKLSGMDSRGIQSDATKLFFKKDFDTENLVK